LQSVFTKVSLCFEILSILNGIADNSFEISADCATLVNRADINKIKDTDIQIKTGGNYSGSPDTNPDQNNPDSSGGGRDAYVVAIQAILHDVFGENVGVDGVYGDKTRQAMRNVQNRVGVGATGSFDDDTRRAMISYIDDLIKITMHEGNTQAYKDAKGTLQELSGVTYYAKGTTGTTKGQFAITDEPWLGDELVLVPTAQGNLQYMRKGTSVIPADITKNLVEWGKISPNMANMSGVGTNLNIINNAVNKPELNLSFDSLVHVDNCSQDTIKDLEKMIDTKINQFSRQLNYSLKKVGAR
jgi:peptidoglycan hydrolase-like protein with peptidoglycan-binding domain